MICSYGTLVFLKHLRLTNHVPKFGVVIRYYVFDPGSCDFATILSSDLSLS